MKMDEKIFSEIFTIPGDNVTNFGWSPFDHFNKLIVSLYIIIYLQNRSS
jgi:hypothetical protein